MDLLKPLEPIVPKKCCASKNTSSKGITIQLSASLPLSPSISPPITPTTSTELNGFKASMMVPGVPVQCCPSKASAISSKIHPVVSATTKTTDHPRPPNIGPTDIPIPCCSIEKINPEGKRTRIVTCRCGDSCACPGCDAHPSRAMKTSRDPYTGFGADVSARRRLSIAAICEPVVCDEPSALLESCGCGCQQVFGSCLDEMLYAIHP
ncbi:hypothetical protein CLU79DRAFT_30002 [Phycomyces nitens]|nr:hypothetical protein CLU79DRAFT_30002 [Phycomyces nitens]